MEVHDASEVPAAHGLNMALVVQSHLNMTTTQTMQVQNIPQKGYTKYGVRHERAPLMGHHADVTPGVSIRLHGVETNRHGGPAAYDLTFKLGDSAVYGSYNLTYTGEITAIGEKTVTITETHYGRNDAGERVLVYGRVHRLELADFSRQNSDYDADKIAARNAAWSD